MQIVWQVRIKGKYYNQTGGDDAKTHSPLPFDEYVGKNLPDDFSGEVIRRVEFDHPKYASEGWQLNTMSPIEYATMYMGGPGN